MDDYLLTKSMPANLGVSTNFNVERNFFVRVTDSNNGSYTSSRIRIDASVAANSSNFVSLSGSHLTIPLTLTSSWNMNDNTVDGNKQYFASLKNGLAAIIDSFSLSLGGAQIVTHSAMTNARISYELAQKVNPTDAHRYQEMGFEYEDGVAFLRSGTVNKNGVLGVQATGTEGRKKRCERVSPRADQLVYQDAARVSRIYNMTAEMIEWRLYVRVDLGLLHDCCKQFPLIRMAYFTFEFLVNAPITIVATTSNGIVNDVVENKTFQTIDVTCPHQFNPVELAPLTYEYAGEIGTGTQLTTKLTVGIPDEMPACELAMRSFRLDPNVEEKYLANPIRLFKYLNAEHISVENVANGATVSRLLHSNIANARKLVIMPYESAGAGQFPAETLSPFSSFGCGVLSTINGIAACNRLQVLMSGQAVFQEGPLVYESDYWSNFRDDSINGGLPGATNSGLVSYEAWSRGAQGAVVVDLSRIPGAIDNLSKNITVNLINNSGRTMSYLFFLYHEMELQVNCSTGSIVRETI